MWGRGEYWRALDFAVGRAAAEPTDAMLRFMVETLFRPQQADDETPDPLRHLLE